MNREPASVLAMLNEQPVVLMQRSTPAAVMVLPAEWNATAKLINDLRTQLDRERRLRVSNQWAAQVLEDPSIAVGQDEFDRMLADAGLAE